MQVFGHYLYEFRKGVREMVLCTLPAELLEKAISRLQKSGISYMEQKLPNGNVNLFFGKEECLQVTRKICNGKSLNELTPEEDFMIGILLGYSVSEQCQRYCKKTRKKDHTQSIIYFYR